MKRQLGASCGEILHVCNACGQTPFFLRRLDGARPESYPADRKQHDLCVADLVSRGRTDDENAIENTAFLFAVATWRRRSNLRGPRTQVGPRSRPTKMRVRATASSLLIGISLCLFAFSTSAQQKEWTWKDSNGKVRSRTDLDEILKQHRIWLKSNGKSGSRANLGGAILIGVDLVYEELSGTDLSFADLSGAILIGTDLSRTFLLGADLTGASLYYANLSEASFEPKNLPMLEGVAQARGLELLEYEDNPGPLTQLRKQFQDGGYREQERAITCALNRHEAELDSPVERWFKRIAFDLTCQYGLSPGRPLRIVGLLWLLFSIVYAVFMHRPGKSGIYLLGTRLDRKSVV